MNELLKKHYNQSGSTLSFDEWNKERLNQLAWVADQSNLSLDDLTESDRNAIITG
jgi:hypothetical protein